MFDINVICDEIKKLEEYEPSQDVCKKLAILYIIKDHHKKEEKSSPMSSTAMMAPMMEK